MAIFNTETRTLTLTCTHKNPIDIKLRNSGIVTIDEKCKAYGGLFILNTRQDIDGGSLPETFVPTFDITDEIRASTITSRTSTYNLTSWRN